MKIRFCFPGICILLSLSLLGQTASSPSSSIPLEELTIAQVQAAYARGDFSIQELTRAYLSRIRTIDQRGPRLGSVIMINPDAMQIAAELDRERLAGNIRGPLHGIPVLLKDNIDTHDKMPNTAGSRALRNSYPLQDSWVAKRLREAGAVILGKANLSEWANFRGELSTSGWSGVGGQTNNPYILNCNPCGSSSGSGVAVSANLCMLAIGTETNGSIVCPSSTNGIVGIKPTVGLISRSGIIPISYTQDTPGPMARTVTDAAVCLGALAGVDSTDNKTLVSEGRFYTDYSQFLKDDGLKGKRLGLFTRPMGRHYKVDSVMAKAVEFLKREGAEVVAIQDVITPAANGASFEVMLYEFKDGLNRYLATLGPDVPVKSLADVIAFNLADSVELRYFDQELLKKAQAKGGLNEPAYLEALEKMLTGAREEGIDRIMDSLQLDAIIAPTGAPAWKTDWVNGDHYMLGSSSPAALAGYPNISVPMGMVDGLPVGISFFGRAWSEPLLLAMAYAYEQGTKHRQAPRFIRQ